MLKVLLLFLCPLCINQSVFECTLVSTIRWMYNCKVTKCVSSHRPAAWSGPLRCLGYQLQDTEMENFMCHSSSTCSWTQSQKTVFYARSHTTGSLLHTKCSEEQKQAVILSLTPPCLAKISHWSLTPTSVCDVSGVKMMQHYHTVEFHCW